MNNKNNVLSDFVLTAKNEVLSCLNNMPIDGLEAAANFIIDVNSRGGRVHITGIGKPGHVSGYISSLMSSTGTSTYFLHGTEAIHGSCGQLERGDVVICISNSGETMELKNTVLAIKTNGCSIIGVSGSSNSWLALQSDIHILAHVNHEGGPLDRAPRLSIIAQTLILQALTVILQARHEITLTEYVMWHPGGTLGQIRDNDNN